jgi:vancomycin resistance protein VanJ
MTVMRWRRELSAVAALGFGAALFWAGRFWAQHFIPYLGLACLAAALLCAGLRLWLSAAAWAIASGLALAPAAPAFLPRSPLPQAGCRISVLAFNMWENPPDPPAAAGLLARLHPDLVFAEKVYSTAAFRDRLLADGFAGYHGFASRHSVLLLSRFPFVRTNDARYGTSADIAVEGHEVRLQNMYVTRPIPNPRPYLFDMAQLRQAVGTYRGPLILAGDANATPFTPEIRALDGLLRDAWDEAGYGLGATFPGPWRRLGVLGPWLRIDYVFHNAAFAAVAARRIDDAAGAGHYPVWAELALLGAGQPGRPCR